MKTMFEKNKKGFALIEVMIAALVLTVGALAFLKLQHRGLQYSFNDYARSQGVAITQGFVEKLRGNTTVVDAYKACHVSSESVKCEPTIQATFQKQIKLTQKQMADSIKGQTILCFIKKGDNKNNRELHLTFMWVDSTIKDAKKVDLNYSYCPKKFGDTISFIENSVTIYATL